MTLHLGKGRSPAAALVSLLVLSLVLALALTLVTLALPSVTSKATAATPLTVGQAIGQQTGATQTVRGYVVGQPTATNTVVRSGFPSDYAPAIGKTGTALRTSLHDIIDNHTKLSYDAVWTALKDTDQDPGNTANVIELYTGRSISKSSNGGNAGQWNREHVFAQSRGGFTTSAGPGTDLHHLRAEDVTVNGTRGNKDFDDGGSAVSGCTDCWTDGDSFEPRDAVKGDVARMLFYMAVRYEGDDGFTDLELSTTVGSAVPRIGDLDILLAWNAADPVDAFEMRRNDRIHAQWQGNRNPFIDHPEWASAIWN
jgi:endonuclease I